MKYSESESLKLHNQLCFTLYSTSLAMSRLYKPLLSKLHLTYPQYLIMLILWERDGITVTDISKLLHQEKGALSPVIKRLEKQQLIVRQRNKQDDRLVNISLTKAGQQLKEQAASIPQQILCSTGLEINDVLTLKAKLEQVRNSLD
ncbi:MarR family winged helix-turn-helix transcriptional regulator [Neptunicella sp. SCSIO 80796]|uniref:MarR family winged helix-turn-helix transcriptional regulator n=1 Tax=Neptunicella plasticusilytica TaxID=3117012 RepID=UPI003A4D67D6